MTREQFDITKAMFEADLAFLQNAVKEAEQGSNGATLHECGLAMFDFSYRLHPRKEWLVA